jgi:hypothetical protein
MLAKWQHVKFWKKKPLMLNTNFLTVEIFEDIPSGVVGIQIQSMLQNMHNNASPNSHSNLVLQRHSWSLQVTCCTCLSWCSQNSFAANKNKTEQEFEATHSWVLASSQNELKVKHPPHETPPLKSGKIRVSRVSYGPHKFCCLWVGGKQKNKENKKTKGLQIDTHKSSKTVFLASCKKVYIYILSITCATSEMFKTSTTAWWKLTSVGSACSCSVSGSFILSFLFLVFTTATVDLT